MVAEFEFDPVARIITVKAPTIDITLQELINAIQDWQDELIHMDVDNIALASGKQYLSTGVYVGLTIQLLNWKIKFEDRPGPVWAFCSISGGNLVAVDGAGVPMNPLSTSTFINITLEKATSAALLAGSGGITVGDIWNEPKAGYIVPGSFGDYLDSQVSAAAKEITLGAVQTTIGIAGAGLTAIPPPPGMAKDATVAKEATIVALGSIVDEVLDLQENKLIINQPTSEWWLYDAAGINVIKKWPLRDKDGNNIILAMGAVSNRGRRTL